MNVLVFTTTVKSKTQVRELEPHLNSLVGLGNWNFALDDRERILRIASASTNSNAAIRLLEERGFRCREL